MIQNRIVCFRIDEHIDHRISRILGSRYSTRSRLIRTAVERLLSHEESRSGSKQRRRQFSGVELIVIRTDQQGFVTNIEPVQINDEDVPHITAAVQYEFAVTLESA